MQDQGTPELQIIRYPDSRLRQVCADIRRFDEQLATAAAGMLDLMKQFDGVGLAASQVGLMIRLFVCNHSGECQDDQVYVNPTLEELSGSEEGEEGCLCLPGVLGPVARATSCRIRAVDLTGQPVVRSADGLLARIWQHEVDHLAGRLIIDRLSPASKIANRRAIKYLEEQFTED